MRSPYLWLASIRSPTFVFEGVQGNWVALQMLARSSHNPKAHFLAVRGATHFSILAPVNRLIAQKVLKDEGPQSNLAFTEDELNKLPRK